jgi:hypothetical protein
MTRQHSRPVRIGIDDLVSSLERLSLSGVGTRIDERFLQKLIERSPNLLPLTEIDATFSNPIHLCRELSTPAGPIDNFLVTSSGHPIIVECKLWRNPGARREVIGQILDYAKEMARFTSADLQREVNRRLGTNGDVVFDLVQKSCPETDQIAFNDSLSRNLRKGRFMLLIVGDGIREGVETIAEYLAEHSGLHFTLGLVELPVFELPNGELLVTPRVVANTTLIRRTVFEHAPEDPFDREHEISQLPNTNMTTSAFGEECLAFWTEFLDVLELSDPQQPRPKPGRIGNIRFNLPVPGSSAWLTVFKAEKNRVGVFVSCRSGSVGEEVVEKLKDRWNDSLASQVGLEASEEYDGVFLGDTLWVDPMASTENREKALDWLRTRTNDFINMLRLEVPRIVEQLGP